MTFISAYLLFFSKTSVSIIILYTLFKTKFQKMNIKIILLKLVYHTLIRALDGRNFFLMITFTQCISLKKYIHKVHYMNLQTNIVLNHKIKFVINNYQYWYPCLLFFLGMYAIIKADIYLNKRYFHLVDEIIKINFLCVCYACA